MWICAREGVSVCEWMRECVLWKRERAGREGERRGDGQDPASGGVV